MSDLFGQTAVTGIDVSFGGVCVETGTEDLVSTLPDAAEAHLFQFLVIRAELLSKKHWHKLAGNPRRTHPAIEDPLPGGPDAVSRPPFESWGNGAWRRRWTMRERILRITVNRRINSSA
jgi:hypothetical protein